jgi:hypothetical protein
MKMNYTLDDKRLLANICFGYPSDSEAEGTIEVRLGDSETVIWCGHTDIDKVVSRVPFLEESIEEPVLVFVNSKNVYPKRG